MEGQATTVYAQGGRGNARLMAWEGERTVTFTMEDALISPEGLAILTGAGLIESGADSPVYVHMTETFDIHDSRVSADSGSLEITLKKTPYHAAGADYCYVLLMKDGEVFTEPYIVLEAGNGFTGNKIKVLKSSQANNHDTSETYAGNDLDDDIAKADAVLVDYYYKDVDGGAFEMNITADKFAGNYYLEAFTLWRDRNGVDYPAEFIIPNCKIQSNFTFSMSASGDPSTFTFNMDAIPDYTRFNRSKKVLAQIQVLSNLEAIEDEYRTETWAGSEASEG